MTSTRQFRNFESKFLNANSSVSTFKVFSWNWLPFASDFMGKFYWKVFVNSNILHDDARFVKLVKRNMQDREMSSQGGNYGNLLSHILCKNFVKVTVLLKKLLNSWFDEILSFSTEWKIEFLYGLLNKLLGWNSLCNFNFFRQITNLLQHPMGKKALHNLFFSSNWQKSWNTKFFRQFWRKNLNLKFFRHFDENFMNCKVLSPTVYPLQFREKICKGFCPMGLCKGF